MKAHIKTSILRTSACAIALLICGMAALPATAQDATGQLSGAAVQKTVPPAFPLDDAAPAATVPATPPVTDTEETAETKPAAAAPAEPEQRRLVPATAMGAAAQGAAAPAPGAPPVNVPNPVEDSAAAPVPAMPDILEKYSARATTVAEDQGESDQPGDALPQVATPKIEGGFAPGSTIDPGLTAAKPGQTDEELQEGIRSDAYDAAITGMFPLSPEQIRELLKRYDTTQVAVKTPVNASPKPEITVQNISLDPGVLPPTIKTAVGNVTTINILDATGAPWPVQDVTWAGDFEVVEPEEGGHIIRITPMSEFARGNIVVRMLTLKTPLTLTLETGRDVVQYRVDARIPEFGPFASAPLMQGAKSTLAAGDSIQTSVLDGVMPGGMTRLEVSGVDGRTTAYVMDGTTYVRTPLTLLSPAWQSSISSADGMNVYALSSAPVVLLSDGGEFVRATLKEKEDLLDE